jgi:tight adherence protein C
MMEFATILVFFCIVTFVLALGMLEVGRPTRERLERLSAGSVVGQAQNDSENVSTNDSPSRIEVWIGGMLGIPMSTANQRDDGVHRRLTEAGYRRPSAIIVYTMTRLTLAILFPLIALGMSPLWSLDHAQLLTVLAVAVVAGLVLPSHWVDRRRAARQGQIICGLPDALDLMVVCVEAGLGIQASLSRISKEFRRTNPILSAEFELVTLEVRAGKSTTEALRAFAWRSGVTDVSSLVAMLVQTERFGTSLADTLRVQADAMRIARMQRAEEQAGKAPLRMMFPTILIFAATLLVTLGPGMMQLMSFFEKGR